MGRWASLVVGASLLAAGCAESPATVTPVGDPDTDLALLFAYEDGPPEFTLADVRPGDGYDTLDIAYEGREGAPVDAFLVVPDNSGPFAAVIFMHQGGDTRAEFLQEAGTLAQEGVVSLLVGIPWRQDAEQFTDVVVALRRGTDLLIERSDVDPARLGYVGHSWGATFGTILAAVDCRFGAYVLIAGADSLADLLEDQSLRPFDSAPYLRAAQPVPTLFQYGVNDSLVPPRIALRLFDLATEPKEVRSYPTDHNFRDEVARQDRREWLLKNLGD